MQREGQARVRLVRPSTPDARDSALGLPCCCGRFRVAIRRVDSSAQAGLRQMPGPSPGSIQLRRRSSRRLHALRTAAEDCLARRRRGPEPCPRQRRGQACRLRAPAKRSRQGNSRRCHRCPTPVLDELRPRAVLHRSGPGTDSRRWRTPRAARPQRRRARSKAGVRRHRPSRRSAWSPSRSSGRIRCQVISVPDRA